MEFELNGQKFMGLNGGPDFKFSEAISFMIECQTQEVSFHYRYRDKREPKINDSWCSPSLTKQYPWQIVPN